jgi:hypothetical protein
MTSRDYAYTGSLNTPPLEALVQWIEADVRKRIEHGERPTPRRGSKEAALRHFGIFREDEDLEQRLNDVRALREAAP